MRDELAVYRQKIDEIDTKIQQLLVQRFSYTKQIGQYKKEHQMPILNEKREAYIYDKIDATFPSDDAQIVKKIYKEIMKESRKQQV